MSFDLVSVYELLTYCISGVAATLGFVLVCHIKIKRMPAALIGAALTIIVWYFTERLTGSMFFSNMLASVTATAYAEIAARVTKTPATVYLVPGIIALVPGGKLYYTMAALVASDTEAFRAYGYETLEIALGIAVGIVIVSTLFSFIMAQKNHFAAASVKR